jgi:uncharacterized repeat protein (TIGR04076 family)
MPYFDFTKLSVNVDSDNSCPFFCALNKKIYSGGELFPSNICPYAFQVIYPYYLTLTNGGWFNWVRPKGGVIVQCPNPRGALEMKIFQESSLKGVKVEVLQAKGECSWGHKKGDTFILNHDTFSFCPKVLDVFIPYFKLVEKGTQMPWLDKDSNFILKCPNITCGNAQFIIKGNR